MKTRVDQGSIVAEVRLSVNLNALTIEQVVGKMKRAQLDLARLVELDGPSAKLTALQRDLMRRDAAWFNEPHNFKEATKQVLEARGERGGGGVGRPRRGTVGQRGVAPASQSAAKMDAEWTTAAWLDSLGAADHVARALNGDSPDELSAVRSLGGASKAQLADRLRGLAKELAVALWPSLQQLAEAEATAAELHNKFIQDPKAITLHFNDLFTFFGGLEGQIGVPELDFRAAMEKEHTRSEDSDDRFTANGETSTPRREWGFVVDPEAAARESWSGRTPLALPVLEERLKDKNMKLAAAKAEPLLLEEAFAARLYTGPMYVKYNVNLRGSGDALDGCKGNKYVTTTHVINSVIVKASKLTKVAKVYRGVAGVLPDRFCEDDVHGFRGGVE
eukprot:6113469-Prymnesium_polylepis.1